MDNQRYNENVALLWSELVGPYRPSISELNVYTEICHNLQENFKRKLDILILGSTTEFRDWAYEENFNVTVIDANYEYYKEISKYLKHKNIIKNENVVTCKWEEMNFNNEFDIVIGDLVLGTVEKSKIEIFIKKIHKSLRNHGVFLGKNYLIPNKYIKKSPEEIAKKYILTSSYYNPVFFMISDLVLYSVDENNMIDFKIIYDELLKLKNKNVINNDILNKFKIIKLESRINFKYNVPDQNKYETLIKNILILKILDMDLIFIPKIFHYIF